MNLSRSLLALVFFIFYAKILLDATSEPHQIYERVVFKPHSLIINDLVQNSTRLEWVYPVFISHSDCNLLKNCKIHA